MVVVAGVRVERGGDGVIGDAVYVVGTVIVGGTVDVVSGVVVVEGTVDGVGIVVGNAVNVVGVVVAEGTVDVESVVFGVVVTVDDVISERKKRGRRLIIAAYILDSVLFYSE